ncbi:peptidoglycan recognition protein [Stomoxys calcitrans]|uniref:peptidoglycan recognition protein n=1 Tax=Stomoxys calcitrans TaxID=35570 RepID=UPI0027E2640A|nr:peptidoglycan recognition protein [Stomoxys calcitrans]
MVDIPKNEVQRNVLSRTDSIESSDSESDSYGEEEPYKNIRDLSISEVNEENIDSSVEQLLRNIPSTSFGDVNINNSSNVVLGNIIKIKGDLIINTNHKECNNDHNKKKENERNEVIHMKQQVNLNKPESETVEHFITRSRWGAMDPAEDYTYTEEPMDVVIIAHTATNSSTETLANMVIVRDIQAFHIGEQDWSDIGYNFLIGCDGKIYEGRGWGVVGAHTYGYNKISICIAFIGCFLSKLPTPAALNACKTLLNMGIAEGHLTSNFKLMGHLQCINTQSPGRKLYKEIQTWEHFYLKEQTQT